MRSPYLSKMAPLSKFVVIITALPSEKRVSNMSYIYSIVTFLYICSVPKSSIMSMSALRSSSSMCAFAARSEV